MVIKHTKNSAYYLVFPMVDSSTPASFKTGETVTDTGYYKDGSGSWTSLAITDTVSEIGSTGLYEIDLTASELNHDQVVIKFSAGSSADTAIIFDLSPQGVDVIEVNGDASAAQDLANNIPNLDTTCSLLATAANLATVDGIVDSILTDTGTTIPATLSAIETDTQDLQTQIGTAGAGFTSTALLNRIADHIIHRTYANAEASSDGDTQAADSRSLLWAIAKLVNKIDVDGSTLRIKKDDDSTDLYTQAITTTSGADPITTLDTA